jgi:Spy/CpxP family protein refolding chaperone
MNMKMTSIVLGLAVALTVVGSLLAADEEGAKPGRRGQRGGMMGGGMMGGMMDPSALIDQVADKLKLTDDQKAKLADVKKEFGPKLKESRDKADSILTDDQKKAREEAVKKMRESRKFEPGAIQEAMKLTADQKEKLEKAHKATGEIAQQYREKLESVLTADQKDQLKKLRSELRGGPRGERGKRNRDK